MLPVSPYTNIDEFVGGGLEPVIAPLATRSDASAYLSTLTAGEFMYPRPRPKITALVWDNRLGKAEEFEDDLLLVMDEGVYIGNIYGTYFKTIFVPWQDVLASTIPLSDLRNGHPPT